MQIGWNFCKAEIGLMIFKYAGGVSESTPISMTKRSQLILHGEIISVKCKNDMRLINTFCFMHKMTRSSQIHSASYKKLYVSSKYIVSCTKLYEVHKYIPFRVKMILRSYMHSAPGKNGTKFTSTLKWY